MTHAPYGKSRQQRSWLLAMAVAMVAFAALAGTGLLSGQDARAAGTVVVTQTNGVDWFPADTRTPGVGTFRIGPGTPPLGTGSFEMKTLTNPEKVQLFTNRYAGTLLSNVQGIGYSTYRDPSSTGFIAGVAALNIRVDLDGNGTADAYMVYEPYQDQGNAAVLTGVWQNWDAYRAGAAKWWINTGAPGCGQATPCTWSAIVAAYPNATVREAVNCGPAGITSPCPGSLGVNQGSFNSGIISSVDALYVNVLGDTTTFNFEPVPQCTTVCYANSATGNDANGGASAANAKKTIQAAVNQVSAGGTVIAAAGSYSENVSIPKTLLLKGAQASMPVAARTFPNASESTITGQMTIQAAGVTIDGVAITNPGQSIGILVKTAGDYARIQNTIVDTVGGPTFAGGGGAQGIYLEYGPDNVTVLKSRINNIQSDRSAKAILIGDSTSSNPSLNILIKGNTISNVKSTLKGAYGVQVNNGSSAAPSATGYTTLRVKNNTFSSFVGGWAHAIGLEGDTPVAVIEGNVISGVVDLTPTPFNDAIAVWFEDNPSFASAQVHRNAFNIGSAAYGIAVHPALTGGPVSGTCNWWGAKDGPGVVGPGSGALVTPKVTFSPWLKSANLKGKCDDDDNHNDDNHNDRHNGNDD